MLPTSPKNSSVPMSDEEGLEAPSGLFCREYDLCQAIAPYMDVHFLFPVIEFISSQKVYDEKDLMKMKLELLKPTSMVDFATEVYQQLHNTTEVPKEFESHRGRVLDELSYLKNECQLLLDLIQNEEVMAKLQSEKLLSSAYLEEHHQITGDILEAFYKYAKLQYECGNYEGSLSYLTLYSQLQVVNSDQYMNALWGKLASEILIFKWEDAVADITLLLDAIDNKSFTSPLEQLQQRTWLLHWSLFVFAWFKEGRDAIVEFMFQPRCLEAIQTNAPHLMRYLTAGVIVHKKRRMLMKDLVRVLQQEKNTYRDPVIDFVECLYVNFDFDAAQEKLRECDKVIMSDFFLYEENRTDFMENARVFIFETYCRIHDNIDLSMLADKLGMTCAQAERWIVDLIRGARLDAKIDSKNNVIVMGAQHNTVYQQIIDKTKDLAARTSNLKINFERSLIKGQSSNK